ncbi:MAG: hypothetical protein GY804_14965, partial [Alphaproteobacteria bacterium]|nr:hypothetical protein [Alphaproteobacteria bacterium]
MMTEHFGPVGIGWYYETVKLWTDTLEGETSAHVLVNLYIKDGDEWSKPISGIGGSMLLALEKQRTKPFHSDEAYKMATTDALSVAMKQLGVAADVYMGLSDSKYDKPAEGQPQRQEQLKQIAFASTQQWEDLNKYLKAFQDNNDTKAIDYINEALVAQNLTALEATTIISHCKTKLGEK